MHPQKHPVSYGYGLKHKRNVYVLSNILKLVIFSNDAFNESCFYLFNLVNFTRRAESEKHVC